MMFFSKKTFKYYLSIFIFHICAGFQTKKKRKNTCHDMCIWMCSIDMVTFWKNYMIFFVYDECHNHFWRKWFCELWIGDKVTWGWVHIWGGGKENKMTKERWMWIFLQSNSNESSHLVPRGQNPFKLLYSVMILNTISLPGQ